MEKKLESPKSKIYGLQNRLEEITKKIDIATKNELEGGSAIREIEIKKNNIMNEIQNRVPKIEECKMVEIEINKKIVEKKSIIDSNLTQLEVIQKDIVALEGQETYLEENLRGHTQKNKIGSYWS